jgi:hypothetical protein
MNIYLFTAQELEKILGKGYFYRQAIYRLAEEDAVFTYKVNGVMYFSSQEVWKVLLQKLAEKIHRRFPELHRFFLRVNFSEADKKISVYGFNKNIKITINTEKETEENLLNKIEAIREEVNKMPDLPVNPPSDRPAPPPPPKHPSHPHHPHHKGPEKHHQEIMEVLRRIEDRLARIEDKLN